MVFRTTTKRWEGPFTFVSFEKEMAIVQKTVGRWIFRTAWVRPYTESILGEDPTAKSILSNKYTIKPTDGKIYTG